MKLTRHNGRAGKKGTYNPKHNDRRFDVANSEHIDMERTKQNIYWDCYTGFSSVLTRDRGGENDYSFERIEQLYYFEHYADHIQAQNERNKKTRHTERNRTVEDLLTNNKTCPEESIYQIGTVEESVPGELLAQIAVEFFAELEDKFGSHVHILNWALHLDEGTPHIHERHVFDCENKYGELCPQQEKALEELGVPLPDPEKKKGRNNNRKQTFDAECRNMLFRICAKHNLYLEIEPTYGGRSYLEKQDFIIEKQKKMLTAITMKITDMESLVEEVADTAYEKACEVVADTVRAETQKEDLNTIENFKKWLISPERKISQEKRDFAVKCLDMMQEQIRNAAQKAIKKVRPALQKTEVSRANKEQIKATARESVLDKLTRGKIEADRLNRERLEREGRISQQATKNNMEI